LTSTFDIQIADEQNALAIEVERLVEVARYVLASQGVTAGTISIVLVDDPMMHRLNRRHLDHDYPTDVLSFLLEERRGDRSDIDRESWEIEGEIIISSDTAIRQATEYRWQPGDELLLYLVHGLLHLCGFDDHSEEDRAKMRLREAAILQNWGLTPHYKG